MSDEVKPRATFWSRLGRTLVRLLRILLVLAILAGIAGAVYYGSPYVYNKFIFPIENNTIRLSEVESKQAEDVQQLADQTAELKARLAELETRQTDAAQSIAELQGQVAALNTAIDGHTQSLKQLATVQMRLDELNDASAAQASLLDEKEAALADLQRQVAFSRTIELLTRARLYLSQSNFGMAKEDVQAAQDSLITLQPQIPEEKAAALQGVIARLDLALGNLPEFPVVAVDDVDIAWQLLVNGLPEQASMIITPETITETPTPFYNPTPTATPE